MTTTLSTSGSWTLRQGTPTLGSARYVNMAIGIVRCSGTPGSGTVTMNFGSLPWNQIYMIYHVTAGAASDLTSYPWKANAGTGTSVAVAFDSGPAATSLGFYACAEEGEVAGSFTVPGSTTELDNVVQSANLEMKTAYKLLSPATTNTWTGLDNNWADVAVSLEILQS